MRIVHVRYHFETEGWWAESADLPGWTAVGSSYEDVRRMARTGVAEFAGRDALVEEEGVSFIAMSGGVPGWTGTVQNSAGRSVLRFTQGRLSAPNRIPGESEACA